MELPQHTPGRADDPEERVPQPGESGESVLLPPSLAALLPSTSSSESGDPELSFEYRCLINLAKSRLPAPPPPPLARKVNPYTKERRIFRASPQVILERSKTFARGALEHYNRTNKIKFELLDVWPIVMMPESCRFYTHINFTARCSKEGSQEKLFFAELYNCGKRRVSSGFLVTYCEPLGSDRTVGHKDFQLDDSGARKNHNFDYCFACTSRMFHPKGERYVAGHCNLPHFYDSPH
ncbi:hypothetical protein ACP70R_008571 [Stipagrostis hirtigluma subsp. patula]